MAKLILSLDNALLSEYTLDKERTTVGRRPSNDIQIDNLAVSGEHAAIIQMGKDYFIEDLDSTNGTLVNAKAVKKHLLQHADVIEFGKYQLKYINEAALANIGMGGGEDDFEKTMIIRPSAMKAMEPAKKPDEPAPAMGVPAVPPSVAASPVRPTPMTSAPAAAPNPGSTSPAASQPAPAATNGDITGRIQVLNGSSSGRELILNKALTTLGKPGVQVAVITKRPNGYFITHVEGGTFPIVNGTSTGAQAFALKDHDVIELAGVKMEFYLGKP
jgi:pSer/pThr/pTyr-binding forkhead associated (FHA) protein